jgi:hypothetical protein
VFHKWLNVSKDVSLRSNKKGSLCSLLDKRCSKNGYFLGNGTVSIFIDFSNNSGFPEKG